MSGDSRRRQPILLAVLPAPCRRWWAAHGGLGRATVLGCTAYALVTGFAGYTAGHGMVPWLVLGCIIALLGWAVFFAIFLLLERFGRLDWAMRQSNGMLLVLVPLAAMSHLMWTIR